MCLWSVELQLEHSFFFVHFSVVFYCVIKFIAMNSFQNHRVSSRIKIHNERRKRKLKMHAPNPIQRKSKDQKWKCIIMHFTTISLSWVLSFIIFYDVFFFPYFSRLCRCPECIVMALMNTYRQFARILFDERKNHLFVRECVRVLSAQWKVKTVKPAKEMIALPFCVLCPSVRTLCVCTDRIQKGRKQKCIYYRLTMLCVLEECTTDQL